MKKLLVPLLAIALFACSGEEGEETTQEVEDVGPDQSDAAAVINFIFDAAKSGDYTGLDKLCIDAAESDENTKMVCFLEDNPNHHDSFNEHFSTGVIVGEPRIKGDECEVDFNFGPDGTDDETMKLVRIDGLWYLQSF